MAKTPKNCILIYRDRAGEYRWRAVARNGKIIADSAEGYVSRANVKRAATHFIKWATYTLPAQQLKVVEVPA
jgi:uncharacterized protein YegP (UPF0339 family)